VISGTNFSNFSAVEWVEANSGGPQPPDRPVVFRGNSPQDEHDIEWLKTQKNVNTIIDLRSNAPCDSNSGAMASEPQWAEKWHIRYVAYPSVAVGNSNRQAIVRHVEEFISQATTPGPDHLEGPFFVHCDVGKVRTGLFIATFRIKQDHWEPSKAMDEMVSHGQTLASSGMRGFIESSVKP
jgi:protein tyrosine/serine phosphatase